MSDLHDAWTGLRHGGNLLSVSALAKLDKDAAPGAAAYGLAGQLRAALVDLPDPSLAKGPAFSHLLDVVCEQVCGLKDGWRKGTQLGTADAERLLDGTVLKPHRLWAIEGHQLALFTTPVKRLGVGKGRRPVARVTEYLRRRGMPLALLTNGRQWRLIWADTDNLAWVEWDAERWIDADWLSPELHVLRLLLSWTSLTATGSKPSPLLLAIRDTRRGQAELSKELGERVRQAVETLLRARRPVLEEDWDAHASTDLYVAACHLIMRLVVLLFAEARELLPIDNPVYHQAYGLRGLLDQLDGLSPERRRSRHSAWPRLLALFRLLHTGSPHPELRVPAYGGDLFKAGRAEGTGMERALALLESISEPPTDDTLHQILVLLTRTQITVEGRRVASPVNFTDLTSEYIGILYEGLLDYELHRAESEPVLFLNVGNQPAIPLNRLEEMDDKTLQALVEKAGGKKNEGADRPEAETASGASDAASEESPEAPVEVDDARAAARERAMAWAERAAVVGKLVKRPRGSSGADPRYMAALDTAAHRLIADIKLPGELYLVRWGGTRKGAGTFYTRPQLTRPTVRRTLAPLTHPEGEVCTPEELLSLNVCDPAMGSGSFLVAVLHTLTEAVKEALYTHERITVDNGRTTVDCALLPEADRLLPSDDFDERLDAIVRRAVVEHCIYGVDLDGLAVELARVSLWVETLDRDLPFTFLDHKLRWGNALVGTWLDRFRDYPLLAFDRESPDRKWKGVNHDSDQWHEALKERRKQAIAEQVQLIEGMTGVVDLPFAGTSQDELKAAVERVRRLYRELRKVPAGRPDERARIWRQRIQTDPALHKVRTAFDTWSALWFWPLDKLDVAPLPSSLPSPSAEALQVVETLRQRLRFFHWELEFPDVFTEERAGFDAIVGNPPWEIDKPSSKEFFSNHDPLYRDYGKQRALRRQWELFTERPALEHDWLAYVGSFKDRGNFVRHAAEPFGDAKVAGHGGGDLSLVRGKASAGLHKTWRGRRARFTGTSDPEHPFRHQGSADLNTYKMFLEVGHALLAEGGELGMIMPSGIYTDKGTGDLRRLLLERCTWRWLFGFENRRKIFDIDGRFKFCVLIAKKGGAGASVRAAFMRHDLEDWGAADGADFVLEYPAERVKAFSPKTLSVLEIRTQQDLEVLTKIYAHGVLLGDDGPEGWGIKYATEFHMTNDSKRFPSREKWEAKGYRPDDYGRWIGPDGDVALPLYEGRMIGQFDFSEKGWVSGKGRTAVWRPIPWTEKVVEPQYLMAEADFRDKRPESPGRSKVSFMDITSATNQRTMIAAALGGVPCGNSAPLLWSRDAIALAGALNSFTYDFVARQRCGGLHLNYFVIEETPLTLPDGLLGAPRSICLLLASGASPTQSWICRTHPKRLGRAALTPHERLRLRAMLDAIVAVLYGLARDDFAWILRDCDHPVAALDRDLTRSLDPKGFWRVDKDQPPELRHTVLSLVAFDALQEHIATAGDRDAGIAAFCDANDGDGWLLPDTLRLADHGLGHDERARSPQPVASALGPRFLEWQLAQTPEESWAECERHARILRGDTAASPPEQPPATDPKLPSSLGPLFDPSHRPEHEHAMITELRIKNFKAWDEAHWAEGIPMARITFVLGTNSAGKSSLLQPLRLIKQTVDSRDAAAQLVLDAPLDLGPFEELVHKRSEATHLGLGIRFRLGERQVGIDGEFELIAGTTGVRSLTYTLDQRHVSVTRSGNTAYQLSTPDANHPGWTGVDLTDPKKNARQAFKPTRGFELSSDATNALGQPLRSLVMSAMDDLHTLMDRFHYLGPIRRVPDREIRWKQQDRTVLGEDGAEAVQVLLSESRRGKEQRTILNAVSRWLKHMEVADELVVDRIGRSMLYEIRIRRGDDSSNIVDVGMGVSQVLPVLVLLHFAPEGSVIMLDEPSVHLHPLAQSRLADAIATVAKERDLQILMETHSEHMFRRVQYLLAAETLKPSDCALYYVERNQPAATLVSLKVDEYGRIKNWPHHFFGDALEQTEAQMEEMFKRMSQGDHSAR